MLKPIKNVDGLIYFIDFLDNYNVVEQGAIESVVIDKKGRLNIFTVGGRHFMLKRSDYTNQIDVLNVLFTNNENPVERTNSFVYVIYDNETNTIRNAFVDEKRCIEAYEFLQERQYNKYLTWKAINLKYALERNN